uniref:MYND-type domain-containing protein n=1 Tax=Chromera velia CCMP2878 TaxID=1169474 RepID=A0A0G4GC17_9ALVE|eukprot:Cvel_21237.t1-p1 / transcript=Cvel_21237.t1 / gene=Cvel_21237 / organism=Chromera_velia_CCMP2878 / gene_product=hypothetical protein / transcript_product=hypothetical protein / location=Cvel_scaffold1975:7999-10345(+) / protein_length=658 / sequence_SO=supercontig / SO=protein_coding / is_pseudo=false
MKTDTASEKGTISEGCGSVDGIFPDFVLLGEEFAPLRSAVTRIVGANALLDRVVLKAKDTLPAEVDVEQLRSKQILEWHEKEGGKGIELRAKKVEVEEFSVPLKEDGRTDVQVEQESYANDYQIAERIANLSRSFQTVCQQLTDAVNEFEKLIRPALFRRSVPIQDLMLHVEALNACAPPGASEEETGALDFAPFFRSLYCSVRSSYRDSAYYRLVSFGARLVVVEMFGMSAEVKRAERSAFASPDVSEIALSLFRDALDILSSGRKLQRQDFITAVKAVEMSLQNPAVIRRVESDRQRVSQALQRIQTAWKDSLQQQPQKDTQQQTESGGNGCFLGGEECRLRRLLSLLILQLQRNSSRRARNRTPATPLTSLSALVDAEFEQQKEGKGQGCVKETTLPDFSVALSEEEKENAPPQPQPPPACVNPPVTNLPPLPIPSEAEEETDAEQKGIAREQQGQAATTKERGKQSATEGEETRKEEGEAGTEKTTFHPLKSRQELKRLAPALCICTRCGQKTTKPKSCAGCKLTLYCSRECQKAHWAPASAVKRKDSSCAAKAVPEGMAAPKGTCGHWGYHQRRCALLKERVHSVILPDPLPESDPPRPTKAAAAPAGSQSHTQYETVGADPNPRMTPAPEPQAPTDPVPAANLPLALTRSHN